jgi:hypothetical protein
MLYVAHRVNCIELLLKTKAHWGIEIDVRSYDDSLILEHDPFTQGERMLDWLEHYRNSLLIVNVKEEGLEKFVTKLLGDKAISNYFFLDQSFPSMMRYMKEENCQVAARISDVECIETAITTDALWTWLDSHSGDWNYLSSTIPRLKSAGKKTCLVSPELQGRFHLKEYENLLYYCANNKVDAICSKFPSAWESGDITVIKEAIKIYQSSIEE